MGRKARPWPRKGRTGFWTKVAGQFVRLADTEREAWVELQRIRGMPSEDARITVERLFDLWLDAIRRDVEATTWESYRKYAQSFIDRHGRVLARDVRERHVDAWLDAHPAWKGCRSLATSVARMPFRWAKRKGYLEQNPLSEMRGRGTGVRRPAPPGAVAAIPQGIRSEEFADLFAFMAATGVRPGEARTLLAERIDLDAGLAIVSGKKGLRPIVLPDAAIEPLRRALARHPHGHVFLNTKGEPWTPGALSEQVRRARQRLGIKDVVAYHARGDLASRLHAAGVDAATIAEILGHKDISRLRTLITHYLKVAPETIRTALGRVSGEPRDDSPGESRARPGKTPDRRRGPKGGSSPSRP